MKLEPLEKDNFYHIYNRGINGESIFLNNENKRYFLTLLDKYLNSCTEIYAFCLMDNHFHLLIKAEVDGEVVTQQFSNLFNAYAKAINKSVGRTGSLFEKHFKRIRIDNEDYLRQVIVYIHLNPKHHFDLDFSKFTYSSYQSLSSDKETKLDRDEVLGLFGGRENFVYVHHQRNDIIEQLMLE